LSLPSNIVGNDEGPVCAGPSEAFARKNLQNASVHQLPAATAAAATTAAATVATATAAAIAATTTAATATRLVLSLIDAQRTAAHRVTVQRLNGASSIGLGHFHEPEATRATRLSVGRECNGLNRAMLREQRTDRSLIRRKREVANVNLRHDVSISNNSFIFE
jgi:hypothetical protein